MHLGMEEEEEEVEVEVEEADEEDSSHSFGGGNTETVLEDLEEGPEEVDLSFPQSLSCSLHAKKGNRERESVCVCVCVLPCPRAGWR